MIDHLSTYCLDYPASKRFYEAALAPLGYGLQGEMSFEADPDLPGRRACAFGLPGRFTFWVIETKQAASPRHVAFAAADRASVAAFHEAALAAGGSDFGAPGPRPIYHKDYFGAFITDPDGNNVEAVCRVPEA